MRDDTLLRLRAADAGFDVELPRDGEWLHFRAAGNLTSLWIAGDGHTHRVAAAPSSVSAEVGPLYLVERVDAPGPSAASAVWSCVGDRALDELCRRLAVLGHVLPDQPLKRYEKAVGQVLAEQGGERTTERVAEVRRRVGQAQFRDALEKYWDGRCPITGIAEAALLRASHAKPWADCTDRERLDVHNGILLSALWDAAFDAGLVSIGLDGKVMYSSRLATRDRQALESSVTKLPLALADGHGPYLRWHRERVFKA